MHQMIVGLIRSEPRDDEDAGLHRHVSAMLIQSAARGKQSRTAIARQQEAAVLIQKSWPRRRLPETRDERDQKPLSLRIRNHISAAYPTLLFLAAVVALLLLTVSAAEHKGAAGAAVEAVGVTDPSEQFLRLVNDTGLPHRRRSSGAGRCWRRTKVGAKVEKLKAGAGLLPPKKATEVAAEVEAVLHAEAAAEAKAVMQAEAAASNSLLRLRQEKAAFLAEVGGSAVAIADGLKRQLAAIRMRLVRLVGIAICSCLRLVGRRCAQVLL